MTAQKHDHKLCLGIKGRSICGANCKCCCHDYTPTQDEINALALAATMGSDECDYGV